MNSDEPIVQYAKLAAAAAEHQAEAARMQAQAVRTLSHSTDQLVRATRWLVVAAWIIGLLAMVHVLRPVIPAAWPWLSLGR
jgi:hypothetical protein